MEIHRIIEERKVIEEELGETNHIIEEVSKNISLLNEELTRLDVKRQKLNRNLMLYKISCGMSMS